MRVNGMGQWQGLGLYRAHLLEMHLENFHGWYQGFFLSCQDLGVHLSWLMH